MLIRIGLRQQITIFSLTLLAPQILIHRYAALAAIVIETRIYNNSKLPLSEFHAKKQIRPKTSNNSTYKIDNRNANTTKYEEEIRSLETETATKKNLVDATLQIGESNPAVILIESKLAFLYFDKGFYAKAEPLLKNILDIQEKTLGKSNPETIRSLNNLALTYDKQGLYEKAEELYLKYIEICEKVHGPNHFDVSLGKSNLAYLYLKQGKFTKAEPLFRKALIPTRTYLVQLIQEQP